MRMSIPVVVLLLGAGPVRADEGMWTFDNFPSAKVKERYGFAPDKAWLDHVQKSAVRLAGGCSASFVSSSGLVMTNHHCAHRCIEELSTAKKNYITDGFYARTAAEEQKCPTMEINQLLEITDVSSRIQKATAGKSGGDFAKAEHQAMSEVEKTCVSGNKAVRCDVVTLYAGGKYDLYRYRRFQDVRLVFAPEFSMAFFGGDPDNFEFPRYDLDVSFLRVYADGKPVKLDDWLRWSAAGAKEGELVFVAGNPGKTDRLLTVSQLEFIRDVAQPWTQIYYAELRGVLEEFATKGPEQQRVSQSELFGVENSLKAFKGRQATLVDQSFMDSKHTAEADFRAKIAADPKLKEAAGAFETIAKASAAYRPFYARMMLLEGTPSASRIPVPYGFRGDLFASARILVRLASESSKPNGERLREYTDARLPSIESRLASTAPVHPDLEIELLTYSLTKLREMLGPDDPLVKKVLGKNSPRQTATEAVKGTKLGDPKARLALKAGGPAAIAASRDPMIELAGIIDADARAMRSRFEQDVDAVVTSESAKLARAHFALTGTGSYPDATFSPRLSYATLKGWVEPAGLGGTRAVPTFTRFAGAYDRGTGAFPFELPKSWVAARSRLNLQTPFDQVSDNDIIGGNSGSPLINQKAEVVGLIFDGNIASLGGDYRFDDTTDRAVSVHSSALLQALERIYDAKRVLDEIAPGGTSGSSASGLH
jgi:Peptidase S46